MIYALGYILCMGWAAHMCARSPRPFDVPTVVAILIWPVLVAFVAIERIYVYHIKPGL